MWTQRFVIQRNKEQVQESGDLAALQYSRTYDKQIVGSNRSTLSQIDIKTVSI